jgi:competence protein ComEC
MITNYWHPPNSLLSPNTSVVVGKVIEYKSVSETKIKLKVKLEKETLLAYVKQNENAKKLKVGMKVKLSGNLTVPSKNTIPNTFSYRDYLKTEKIFYQMQVTSLEILKEPSIRYWIQEKIRFYCNQHQNSSYLKKILIGIKEDENESVEESYRQNGISHIFAISGMHLGAIYQFFGHHSKKKKKNILLAYGATVLYYSCIIITPSSKRAFLFLTLNTINQLFNLKQSKGYLFVLAICFVLMENPFVLFQIGFQYSFVVSLVFLIFYEKKQPKWQKMFKSSVIAFLFTIPITACSNYFINPWSIINNLVLVPLMTSFIFPILLLTLIFPVLECISVFLINFFEKINILLTTLPFSIVVMPKISAFWFIIYYFLLVMLFSIKKRVLILLIFLFLEFWHLSSHWDNQGYVHFLDVAQGDSTLIIAPYQKEVILIDTGQKDDYRLKNMLTFFHSLGIKKINTLILSHGDQDHLGNAQNLLKKIKIDHIVLNKGDDTKEEQEIRKNNASKILKHYVSQNISFQTLSLSIKESENENSIVNHVCIYQTCFLFLGDIDASKEQELISKYQIPVDIIKIAHHGSNTSTSKELLQAIKAKHAIISVGKNNLYHHPHQKVIKRLQNQGINILKTFELGTISFEIQRKYYTISTCPP